MARMTSTTSPTTDVFSLGRAINPDGEDEAFLVDLSPNLPGDFNADGQLDALDIDELSAVVREGTHPRRFDLTDDDLVNDDDRVMWVHELKHTYFGDANLDGEFNSSDMTQVFAAGKYETGEDAGWDERRLERRRLLRLQRHGHSVRRWRLREGTEADAAAVPEPTSVLLLVMGLIGFAICRRRLRS